MLGNNWLMMVYPIPHSQLLEPIMSTYFLDWHDYESFGVNPRRHRPAQFASVRTDPELNIVGEPMVVYCRPTPDVLPEPMACLITGISPLEALEKGLPEHQFARMIEQRLGASRTIGTGYNSLNFDDEMTRFALWRSLADPYAREWQNGCGRWDIINMVRAAYAYRPDGIVWPERDGRPTFKLEEIARANGISHTSAHDALSDVYATIGVARLIRRLHPDLYDYCFSMRKKTAASSEIGFPGNKVFVHVDSSYGAERGFTAILSPIATHPTNTNEIVAWDVSKDPGELLTLDAESARARLFTKKDDMPEGVERVPLHSVAINKSPIVMGGLEEITPEFASKFGINVEAALKNADKLEGILSARPIGRLLAGIYQREFDNTDPDEGLYAGFVGKQDRGNLEMIRDLKPQALATCRVQFEDPRLETMLLRYKARNFPEILNDDESKEWKTLVQSRLLDGANGHRTIKEVREEIADLHPTANEKSKRVLDELLQYINDLAASDLLKPSASTVAVSRRMAV